MAMLTMAVLTMTVLTMAVLTMAVLTMAVLTMAMPRVLWLSILQLHLPDGLGVRLLPPHLLARRVQLMLEPVRRRGALSQLGRLRL